MRFGHPKYNAGSVRHLHSNIQVPDCTGRVQITLAKEPEEIAKKLLILEVFEKLRLGALLASLAPSEQELVKGRLGKLEGKV